MAGPLLEWWVGFLCETAVIVLDDDGTVTRNDVIDPSVREAIAVAIPFRAGQCLVDADANEATRLLDVIRALQLPLVLLAIRAARHGGWGPAAAAR